MEEWYLNIQYKIFAIEKLVAVCGDSSQSSSIQNACANNAAYLAGYPLEFLLKMATIIINNPSPNKIKLNRSHKIHAGGRKAPSAKALLEMRENNIDKWFSEKDEAKKMSTQKMDLFLFYLKTSQQSDQSLDILKLINLKLSKFDIQLFRYSPKTTYDGYGYESFEQLLCDLNEIQKDAKQIYINNLSYFGRQS